MTTSSVDRPVHSMEVRTAFYDGEVKSRAHCSCGWSTDVTTTEQARALGAEHRIKAEGAPHRPRRPTAPPSKPARKKK